MSRKGRKAALDAAVEFYGPAITKSADGQDRVFRLAQFLEPAFSTLDKLERHSKAQNKALREQQRQLASLESYLSAMSVPYQGVSLGAAQVHRKAIERQIASGQHFNDLQHDGALAAVRGLTSSPVSPWSYFPEINGHDLQKPSTNGHAAPPPGHPEAEER